MSSIRRRQIIAWLILVGMVIAIAADDTVHRPINLFVIPAMTAGQFVIGLIVGILSAGIAMASINVLFKWLMGDSVNN